MRMQELTTALLDLYPADVVDRIEESKGYFTLKFRVGEWAKAYGMSPAEVLATLPESDREDVGRCVDNPADVLATKIHELPRP